MDKPWETLRPLAALHVLGALEKDEGSSLRQQLSQLGESEKQEYQEWVRIGQLLFLSPPQWAPPPDLKQKILNRAKNEKPQSVGIHFGRGRHSLLERMASQLGISKLRLIQIFCWVLLAFTLLLSVGNYQGYTERMDRMRVSDSLQMVLHQSRERWSAWNKKMKVLAADQLQVVALHSLGQEFVKEGSIKGMFFWDPLLGTALLQVKGLPRTSGVYVLWVMTEAQAFPAFSFQAHPGEQNLYGIAALPETDRRRITAFLLTEETNRLQLRPSGKHWLEGSPVL